ncbi:hypothetical protein Tco_1142449 [Tanacetum coccineum]
MLRRQEQQQLAKDAKNQRRLWNPGIKIFLYPDITLRERKCGDPRVGEFLNLMDAYEDYNTLKLLPNVVHSMARCCYAESGGKLLFSRLYGEWWKPNNTSRLAFKLWKAPMYGA